MCVTVSIFIIIIVSEKLHEENKLSMYIYVCLTPVFMINTVNQPYNYLILSQAFFFVMLCKG